ncbi:MAG: hypothetical protein ABT00_23785 [Bordetella sp. SCN 68-11]|nr:MAG: hypothetical protein ABT00_23785 [Bordetella sp. SCN 68-11]
MPSRRTGSASASGSGTLPSTATTISGEVPQVTCGKMEAASISTTVSNAAPSSERSVRHQVTAWSHCSPLGENGRPRR